MQFHHMDYNIRRLDDYW